MQEEMKIVVLISSRSFVGLCRKTPEQSPSYKWPLRSVFYLFQSIFVQTRQSWQYKYVPKWQQKRKTAQKLHLAGVDVGFSGIRSDTRLNV